MLVSELSKKQTQQISTIQEQEEKIRMLEVSVEEKDRIVERMDELIKERDEVL